MTVATTPRYGQQAQVNETGLNLLFHSARTHGAWLPKPVPEKLLRAIYDVAKWGPTSANSSPARSSCGGQGAYLMLAARGLGLDCGPMSGFDAEKVNAEFFREGKCKVNFICNLGYGDPAKLYPRDPRLDFEEACSVL